MFKMKILVLAIVIFTLNGYVTRATSLDPIDNVQMNDNMKSDDDEDMRNKRSGEIFSTLLNKKLRILGSLTGFGGLSSGKSIGGTDHFPEPLTYHTKSFNLWGVKKAILSSVLQAAKAITGGVIAIKGQLIKAKGHAVVAKGKLMQTKGDAISNFGRNIATHAFDIHQPQVEAPSPIGLFNHLPATPVHQPTSYGVPTALGYGAQLYANNLYSNNAYQAAAAPSFQPGYGAQAQTAGFAVPAQSGYDGGLEYNRYGSNGYKRAVPSSAPKLSINQIAGNYGKEPVQAGLLILKPLTGQGLPAGSPQQSAVNLQQLINKRPSQPATTPQSPYQNQYFGFRAPQANDYQASQTAGLSYPSYGPSAVASSANYLFPSLGGGGGGGNSGGNSGGSSGGGDSAELSFPNHAFGPQTFNVPQPSANSQEFGQPFSGGFSGGFSGQQQSQYSQENYGGDNRNSASRSVERLVLPPPSNKFPRSAEPPKFEATASAEFLVPEFLRPTTMTDSDVHSAFTKKRSTLKKDEDANRTGSGSDDNDDVQVTSTSSETSVTAQKSVRSVTPSKTEYKSNPEEQARLKHTVQRFFSILEKNQQFLLVVNDCYLRILSLKIIQNEKLNFLFLKRSIITKSKINMDKNQNLQKFNGKNKSKHKLIVYAIPSKTNRRKISNNIEEKLFQAKIYAYQEKQNELRLNFLELNKIYQNCTQLSKQMSIPKHKHIDDVERVVARIVDEEFGMRVVAADEKTKNVDPVDPEGEKRTPENGRGAGQPSSDHGNQEAKRSGRPTGGQGHRRELRRLRKHLALAVDRLKLAAKEKRDLLDTVRRNRSETTETDSLRAMLDRERERNVRLQSVVDEMFAAASATRNNCHGRCAD